MSKAFQKSTNSLRYYGTHAREVCTMAFIQYPLLVGCALGYRDYASEVIDLTNDSKLGPEFDRDEGTGANKIMLAIAGWEVVRIYFAEAEVFTAGRKIKLAGVDPKI